MSRKILILDIDGTLTNSKKEITEATKRKLWEIMEAGHMVILGSGRPTPGMRRYEKELELKKYGGYLMSFNGGRIVECATGNVISQLVLPMNVPSELFQFANMEKCGLISYENDLVISAFEPDDYVQWEAHINGLEIKVVDNFAEYIDFPENKCLMTAPPKKAAEIEKKLQKIYGETLSVYRSEPYFIEIMPKGVDKAAGIDSMLRVLGASRHDTIACGDGFNDISMIKYAEVGVAMANAAEEVKEVADFITGSNDEDGLITVIDKFILGKY
ncbi:MAG: Cof-type HAD-IIB family hydrolase [Acetatifactor sp.]|nr:Cof-type HAD-IIB family hydrolase [Acetatifactor sp.]